MYDKVRALCIFYGIPIAVLESDLGFSNGLVRTWKTHLPSVDKAKLVADYFGVSLDTMLDFLPPGPSIFDDGDDNEELPYGIYEGETLDINQ